MRSTFLILLLLASVSRSSALRQAGSRFEGTVTKVNGDPLKGVRVQVAANPLLTAMTDEAGHFTFENVAPGTYNVLVQYDGYVIPGQAPTLGNIGTSVGRITLATGEDVRGFRVEMVGTVAISGRITGTKGEPLPSIGIRGLRRTYQDGQARLTGFNLPSPAATNDRGEYRVISLPAGEYYLMAFAPQGLRTPVIPVYYPGTRDPARAKPIPVKEGEEASNIDFVLQTGSFSITGNVVPYAPRTTLAQMSITPVPRDPASSVLTGYGFAFDPDTTPPGRFSIQTFSLPPGIYDLVAVMTTEEMDYFGSTPVTIGDQPVEKVAIQVRPGIEVKGHVTIRGDATTIKLTDSPVNLRSATYNSANRATQLRMISDVQAMQTARQTGVPPTFTTTIQPTAPVDSDGSFSLRSVPPGTFTILPAVPQGACLIDVLQDGRSVLSSGLTIGTNSPAPLEVGITSVCPTIKGVLSSKNQPQRFSRVVLVPSGDRRRSYGLYRTVMSDQAGGFSFANVTPGEYKLFAWRSIPDGAWTNNEYLAPYEERGTSVSAAEGTVTADVEFILD